MVFTLVNPLHNGRVRDAAQGDEDVEVDVAGDVPHRPVPVGDLDAVAPVHAARQAPAQAAAVVEVAVLVSRVRAGAEIRPDHPRAPPVAAPPARDAAGAAPIDVPASALGEHQRVAGAV